MPKKTRTVAEISKVAKRDRTPAEIKKMQEHRKSVTKAALSGPVGGSNVDLRKGLGKSAGAGIGGSIVPRDDLNGALGLGRNQIEFQGAIFNQKHFAGFVHKAGGVEKARQVLVSSPELMSGLGMSQEQVDESLGSIANRNRKIRKAQGY